MRRHRNNGLLKRCRCARLTWAKCPHPWYFQYQWKGQRRRVQLERLLGRKLKGKTDADAVADQFRAAIRAGTFQPHQAAHQHADELVLEAYAATFLERYSKARQKVSWRDDGYMLKQICAFVLPGGAAVRDEAHRGHHGGRCRGMPPVSAGPWTSSQHAQ